MGMSDQFPFSAFIIPAIVAIGFALIVILVLLLIVKRPYPSREASGAITLTIAAIILISGAWSMWLSPTYETRRYDELTSSSLSIGPLDSMTQTLEVQKGQEVEVHIDAPALPRVEPPVFPVFSVRIYDQKGKLIWAQLNVTNCLFMYTTAPTETGTLKVDIDNPQREAIAPIIHMLDRTRITIRPLEPVGQWLTLVSTPIFVLGYWFTHFKKQN